MTDELTYTNTIPNLGRTTGPGSGGGADALKRMRREPLMDYCEFFQTEEAAQFSTAALAIT